MRKIVLLLMAMLVSFYSPMELTRMIILYARRWCDSLLDISFVMELCLIWLGYSITLGIISLLLWTNIKEDTNAKRK